MVNGTSLHTSCYSLTKRLLPTAREGYVFRGVCLLTGEGGGRVSQEVGYRG